MYHKDKKDTQTPVSISSSASDNTGLTLPAQLAFILRWLTGICSSGDRGGVSGGGGGRGDCGVGSRGGDGGRGGGGGGRHEVEELVCHVAVLLVKVRLWGRWLCQVCLSKVQTFPNRTLVKMLPWKASLGCHEAAPPSMCKTDRCRAEVLQPRLLQMLGEQHKIFDASFRILRHHLRHSQLFSDSNTLQNCMYISRVQDYYNSSKKCSRVSSFSVNT